MSFAQRNHRFVRSACIVMTLALVAPVAVVEAQEDSARTLRRLAQQSRVNRASRQSDIFFGSAENRRLGVRCGTRTPGRQERQLIDMLLQPYMRRAAAKTARETLTVPVVFHIVTTKTGEYDVTDEQIDDQLEVLNAAYSPEGEDDEDEDEDRVRGVEGGIVFELAETLRYEDNAFATKCLKQSVQKKFKKKNAVAPEENLNIYTCLPADGVLGEATFPSDHDEADPQHGVILLYSSFPGGPDAPYNEGATAVHEVGHWLGLYHTFEEEAEAEDEERALACAGLGDLVDDTPAENEAAYGCPEGRDTCPDDPGDDPIRNFMDYTDDACMEEFTEGQAERMEAQLTAFKPTLLGDGEETDDEERR